MDNEDKNSIVPLEWAIKDIAQPTLQQIGLDLKNGYVGLRNIVTNAIKKSQNKGIANNRVTIETLRSGSFVDSDIEIEYFGGILASAKSIDGKDDSSIYYLDIIKSMSSKQLHLHYIIYNSLNMLLKNKEDKIDLNVGLDSELGKEKIYFSTFELNNYLDLNTDINLEALFRKGLISSYKTDLYNIDEKTKTPYSMVSPTALGVQLFAVANNKINEWRNYPKADFENFDNVNLPNFFGSTMEELLKNGKLI